MSAWGEALDGPDAREETGQAIALDRIGQENDLLLVDALMKSIESPAPQIEVLLGTSSKNGGNMSIARYDWGLWPWWYASAKLTFLGGWCSLICVESPILFTLVYHIHWWVWVWSPADPLVDSQSHREIWTWGHSGKVWQNPYQLPWKHIKRSTLKKKSGWWFGCHFLFSHILGMSSSQLTFIFFRGVAQPPTRNGWTPMTMARFDARWNTKTASKTTLAPRWMTPWRLGAEWTKRDGPNMFEMITEVMLRYPTDWRLHFLNHWDCTNCLILFMVGVSPNVSVCENLLRHRR